MKRVVTVVVVPALSVVVCVAVVRDWAEVAIKPVPLE